CGAVLLSQGRHAGLNYRSSRVPRIVQELAKYRSRGAGRFGRHPANPEEISNQVRPALYSAVRFGQESLQRLRRDQRQEHVWQDGEGNRPHHLYCWTRWKDRAYLQQRETRRPRRSSISCAEKRKEVRLVCGQWGAGPLPGSKTRAHAGFPLGGYLVDSSSPYMLRFSSIPGATDDAFVGHGGDGNGLLKQAIEQLAPRTRSTTVEAKSELVEIVGQMVAADGTLVSSQQPALQ